MEITPIFQVALGTSNHVELVPIARQLFEENKNLLRSTDNGLMTTLQSYNSKQNCATLQNQNAVNHIKKIIIEDAKIFYAKLGYAIEYLDFDVDNLWLNEMPSKSQHVPHLHYGYQISGCFYVDTPQNSNLIKLYTPLRRLEHGDNPIVNYNQYNGQFYANYVKEGDLVMWESTIQHSVPSVEFEGIRRSIAFDLKIGKKIEQERNYKMNLQDYVATYNINDAEFCQNIINTINTNEWEKHGYHDPISGESTTYDDDLDITFSDNELTLKLRNFFIECVEDYLRNVVPATFLLQALTQIRFNKYEVGTNMKMHHDHIHTIFDGERKGVPILSVLALLNDDFEGGDFLMFDGKKLKLVAGDVIIFPSNFLYPHGVTTVTKGTRYSCVSWGY
jgi:uncharacterized protein (TIGR02466 family)